MEEKKESRVGKAPKRTKLTECEVLIKASNFKNSRPKANVLAEFGSFGNTPGSPVASSSSQVSASPTGGMFSTTDSPGKRQSLRILFQKVAVGKAIEPTVVSEPRMNTHPYARMNFKWPRTVEAAQSPFDDASGKNKMFFIIAINLFPFSKIVLPDADDEPSEEENDDPKDGHKQ